jgi:molybdopterin-guanine dinucleotide biosynthesis protein A
MDGDGAGTYRMGAGTDGSWSGAVLTGGRSARMGRNKALVEVDGIAMACRVASALVAAGAAEVFCVGGDEAALAALGLEVVADAHPGDGPLGGVLTALRRARHPVVLLAPCDLLAPDVDDLRRTVAVLAGTAPTVDAAVPVVGGRLQPLDGAFRQHAAAALGDAFAGGERSVKRALRDIEVVEVEGFAADAFADADTPADLAGGTGAAGG